MIYIPVLSLIALSHPYLVPFLIFAVSLIILSLMLDIVQLAIGMSQ